MSFSEFLKDGLFDLFLVDSVTSDKKVVKSIPVPKKLLGVIKEIKDETKKISDAMMKAKTKRDLLFSTLQNDLNEFGAGMRVSADGTEIEILK